MYQNPDLGCTFPWVLPKRHASKQQNWKETSVSSYSRTDSQHKENTLLLWRTVLSPPICTAQEISFSLEKGMGGPLYPSISWKQMTRVVRQKNLQLHLVHYIKGRSFHGSNCYTCFLPLSWNLPSYKFWSSEALIESVCFLVHVKALTNGEEIPLWQALLQTKY